MSWTVHLYWLLGWIVLGFGAVEGWAVWHHRRANTFSNSVWVWLGTYSHPANRLWRQLIFTAFWLALWAHFMFGVKAWPWLVVPAFVLAILIDASTFFWKERT